MSAVRVTIMLWPPFDRFSEDQHTAGQFQGAGAGALIGSNPIKAAGDPARAPPRAVRRAAAVAGPRARGAREARRAILHGQRNTRPGALQTRFHRRAESPREPGLLPR